MIPSFGQISKSLSMICNYLNNIGAPVSGHQPQALLVPPAGCSGNLALQTSGSAPAPDPPGPVPLDTALFTRILAPAPAAVDPKAATLGPSTTQQQVSSLCMRQDLTAKWAKGPAPPTTVPTAVGTHTTKGNIQPVKRATLEYIAFVPEGSMLLGLRMDLT